jgi:hypothetical protein
MLGMSQKYFEKNLIFVVVAVVAVVGFGAVAADFDYCTITKKHTACQKDVSMMYYLRETHRHLRKID